MWKKCRTFEEVEKQPQPHRLRDASRRDWYCQVITSLGITEYSVCSYTGNNMRNLSVIDNRNRKSGKKNMRDGPKKRIKIGIQGE
jgi:hypothetical protein